MSLTVRAVLCCRKHPNYKAIRAPKFPGCETCNILWRVLADITLFSKSYEIKRDGSGEDKDERKK